MSNNNNLMDRLKAALTPEAKREKLRLTAAELDRLGVERKSLDAPQTLSVSKELAAAMTGQIKMTEDDVAEMVEGLSEALMATMDEKGYASDDNRDEMRKAIVGVAERMLGQMRDDAEMMAAADDKMDEDEAKMDDDETQKSLAALRTEVGDVAETVKSLEDLSAAVVTMAEGFAEFVDAQADTADAVKALQQRQDKLDALLAQTPRRASNAPETRVTETDEADLVNASKAAKLEALKQRYGYDPTAGGK